MAMPGETIASGASATCDTCFAQPKLEVLRSGAGYYIGTQCACGPYSRESGYFATRAGAQAVLESRTFAGRRGELVFVGEDNRIASTF